MKINQLIKFILILFSCFTLAQSTTKSLYIKIDDTNFSVVKNPDNTLKLTFLSNSTLNTKFSKYKILKFQKAFPTARSLSLKNVYEFQYIESNNLSSSTINQDFPNNEPISEPKKLSYIPNDYRINSWGTDYLDLINVKGAWNITTGNSNIKIGISEWLPFMNHEELIGKVVQVNSSSIIDSHATMVSGMAAGNTNNGKGTVGIGWNCSLLSSNTGLNNMLLMSQAGSRVVNGSWYSGDCSNNRYSQIEQDVVNEIRSNGTILVFAAGNSTTCGSRLNYPIYPASYKNVISVSGVGDRPVGFSYAGYNLYWRDRIEEVIGNQTTTYHWNDHVDIAAPSFALYLPSYSYSNPTNTSFYDGAWGTSFAAPQVAGAVGLMLSANNCLDSDEVDTILKLTSVRLDTIAENAYYKPYLEKGAGRLNAEFAVRLSKLMKENKEIKLNGNGKAFNRWDFVLENAPYQIKLLNYTFENNASIRFKAKNSIVIENNTLLKPSNTTSQYFYVNNTDTCYYPPNSNTTAISSFSGFEEDNINSTNYSDLQAKVYPTVISNKFTIELQGDISKESFNAYIYNINDLSKPLAKNINISQNLTTIDTSDLVKGIYLIKISGRNSTFQQKLIKN